MSVRLSVRKSAAPLRRLDRYLMVWLVMRSVSIVLSSAWWFTRQSLQRTPTRRSSPDGRESTRQFVMDHHVLVRMQIRQICTTRRVQNVRLIQYSDVRTRVSFSGQFVTERLRQASFRLDREKILWWCIMGSVGLSVFWGFIPKSALTFWHQRVFLQGNHELHVKRLLSWV